ncbi:MAG: tRNA glutamyl-Q(34) synthetase GluQRS [Gemmataceae bacterium]|nr:tRNA glutamyl-Q(34) synthetase GluQRS [Gemmataceae bacterium]
MDGAQADVVTRLAPSPTGSQHFGNARTYLISWLMARSVAGRVILRVEDIDAGRTRPGAIDEAVLDLRWLGLDWDEGPIVQSRRLPLYESALARLQAAELVYPCTCTRADIAAAASAPHEQGGEPTYPGTCARRRVADAATLTRPFAWRFRVDHSPAFVDRFVGAVALDLGRFGGDFVVWKSAGEPAYQLAVVVDDAAGGVTDVVRGDDLLPSTPRQLLLYHALGLNPPRFTHVPLVLDAEGRRLAKRQGGHHLSALRTAGVAPEVVIGHLAASCGWIDSPRPMRPADLIPLFSLDTIPRTPWVVHAALAATLS